MTRRQYWLMTWFGLLAVVLALMPPAPQVALAATTIRWGYYVTYADTSAASLRQRVDILTHVSPWYFRLNADGTLTSMEEPATTAFIRSRNVRVVPMIQNVARYDQFAQMLNTPEKMEAVVERIAQIGLRPEYAGVHIDFEGLGYAERPVLTEFMARLAARLRPANKLVTQAIAAKTGESAAGWAAAFDYPALAQHTDLVVIMAYDYHYATGSPGPVAPIDWVRRVARYAADTFGPQKTILGMPLYGYAWPLEKKEGDRAESVSYTGAIELLDRHDGQRGYDERQESEWGRLRRDDTDYEIWFESARSLRPKMEVMQDFRLAGFGVWRLGHEDPAFWDVVREYATPASPHPRVSDTRTRRYFPETRHTLEGKFLEYWTKNGGLARFGFPLTEPFEEVNAQDGQTYTVQYFERARFELHPELAGTPFEVLLGHTGRWALERSGSVPPAPVAHAALGEGLYFPETGRMLGGGFRSYWEQNGGLMQFGLPITDEFDERNPDDGQVYTVQYFERARFEYHPEHQGTPYEVLLGLLGRQMLRERDWIR
jgi:spore germination protein YaaH